jgi:hypothetical protein
MSNEDLTRKLEAQPAVLQSSLHDAALKDWALPTPRLAQLVGTATAGASQMGVARAAVSATNSSQAPSHAVTIVQFRSTRLRLEPIQVLYHIVVASGGSLRQFGVGILKARQVTAIRLGIFEQYTVHQCKQDRANSRR